MTEHQMGEEAGTSGQKADLADLLLRSGFNFHVFLAAGLSFARTHGVTAEAYVDRVSERLAGTWTGLRGHGADAVLQLVLENLASVGFPVHEVTATSAEARAVVGAVPLGLDSGQWQELLAPFGVTPREMQVLLRAFQPLVAAAGASLDVATETDRLLLTVRRRPPGQPVPADMAAFPSESPEV